MVSQSDPDPNRHRLRQAAAQGDLEGVRQLLRDKTALEAMSDDGWTALHESVVHGVELTMLILEAGANPNAASEAGYTPLHRAASKGAIEVAQTLVKYGADPLARDVYENDLVAFANQSRNQAIIDWAKSLLASLPNSSEPRGMERLSNYLDLSFKKAPERLRAARRSGLGSYSGGDGSSEENAIVVYAVDIASGVLGIHEYLRDVFGAHSTGAPGGDPSAVTVGRIECSGRNRRFNSVELMRPNKRRRVVTFEISQWAEAGDLPTVLIAHRHFTNRIQLIADS